MHYSGHCHCGAVKARFQSECTPAVMGEGERIVSTINVVGLRMTDFLDIEEAPADFAAETTEARIARRFDKWTPTRFTNPQLAASYFGPH